MDWAAEVRRLGAVPYTILHAAYQLMHETLLRVEGNTLGFRLYRVPVVIVTFTDGATMYNDRIPGTVAAIRAPAGVVDPAPIIGMTANGCILFPKKPPLFAGNGALASSPKLSLPYDRPRHGHGVRRPGRGGRGRAHGNAAPAHLSGSLPGRARRRQHKLHHGQRPALLAGRRLAGAGTRPHDVRERLHPARRGRMLRHRHAEQADAGKAGGARL